MIDPNDVYRIYRGSDGEATKGLYSWLETLGPLGTIAIDLFRAQKASERAKVYRGGERGRGSYRGMAYEKKQWSIDNLCRSLACGAGLFHGVWGWGIDEKQSYHRHVLYVELPTGQVSFHADHRGEGPDYPREWDGIPNQSADRVCRWIVRLIKASVDA